DLETTGKPGVVERMLDDLLWLGLDWDEGPAYPEEARLGQAVHAQSPQAPYVQSQRSVYYREIHARLLAQDAIYPCVCTRADLAAAQSAPHEGDAAELEPRYPGTCRERFKSYAEACAAAPAGRKPCWRLKTAPGAVEFHDLCFGPQRIDVHATVGDFVIAKDAEVPAYQLAVVADDIAMGVTEVVRGDDLIPSTARQILIYRQLGAPLPAYGHAPLVVGPDGKRLAKRHGDARIHSLREAGVPAEHLLGVLARWSGLEVQGLVAARELLPLWSWKKVPRERVILTPERLREAEGT
ncbi:MAG: tRNA glutamyl-Q(34) synthetase GluQRS, partial [Planctomycetes bacterium]|nr:tRNA glutamyl-Q(34) synthetase GluQRS [Planctomycetota bacterium]